MISTAVIVQARMGSSRLPGKVLMDLAGRTVLRRVIDRCCLIDGSDGVVCAVPEGATDDPVADEASRAGVLVFRGSETDVLARYAGAARLCGATIVMRVTSDCPLIDPTVCAQVLALVRFGGADYATNNMPSEWPHGLDCEAFSAEALFRAEAEAVGAAEREHVTPWLRSNADLVRANLLGPGGWAAKQRWTLDFPEDYRFFREVYTAVSGQGPMLGMAAMLEFLRSHPEIAAINAMHCGASRPPIKADKEKL